MKKILLLLFITVIQLFATQENANNLAKFTSIHLFNLDSQALKETIQIYTKNDQRIKAVEVIEDGKKLFIFYKKNKEDIYYKPIPPEYQKLAIYNAPVVYDNIKLGSLKIYYDTNLIIDLLTPEEKLWLKENKTLKVYNETNTAPFNYIVNNKPKGYSIQYFNLLASKVGLSIDYTSGFTWDEALKKLSAGEIDTVLNIAKNEPREKLFDFTDKKYIDLKNGFITKKSNPLIHSFEQINNKTLAIVKGYNVHDILKDYPKIKILPLDDPVEVLKAVSNGKAYAGHGNSKVFQYLTTKELISNIHFNEYEQEPTPLFMAVKKGDSNLLSILNKAQSVISEEELFELKQRWLLRFNSYQEEINLTNQEKEYLQNKKQLTLCIKPNLLPYEALNNGEYVGIASDYMKLISKKLNLQIKVLPVTSNTHTLELLKNKKCDIKPLIMNSLKMPYEISNSYLNDSISLVTNIQQPFIKNISDYTDKKYVLVPAQQGVMNFIEKEYPSLKIITANSIEEALEMVVNKEAFGYLGKSLSSIYYIQKNYSSILKVMNEFKDIKIGIGVIEDDKILLNIINKALVSVDEQTKIKIRNNWSSTTIQQEIDYTIVIIVSMFFVIVTLVIIFWNIKLKKEITKRQALYKKFEYAVDNALCGYWEWNLTSNTLHVSKGWKEYLGYENDIITDAQQIIELIHPQDKGKVLLAIDNYLEKKSSNYDIDFRLKSKKGEYKWVKSMGVFNQTTNNFYGFHADINEMKQLEEKELEHQKLIFEQSKLAAMGEMIGNIAHQWRQPLSIISTSASGAKLQKEINDLDNESFVKYMNIIISQTEYLSKTIDDFKNFIRGDREKEQFNIQENVNSFLHLVEGTIKKHQIEIITHIDENINLYGHPNELIQCFINIFNNSKDAMEHLQSERLFFISVSLKKDIIKISLKDNGGGIEENTLIHIFEPYFTTKHKSQGTGLGLHMTYNLIVEGMKGSLQAKNKTYTYNNQEYTGAKFIITLPLKTDE